MRTTRIVARQVLDEGKLFATVSYDSVCEGGGSTFVANEVDKGQIKARPAFVFLRVSSNAQQL